MFYRGFAMFLVTILITPPLTLSFIPQQAHAQNVGGAAVSAAGCLVSNLVGGFLGAAGDFVAAAMSVPVSNAAITGATAATAANSWAEIVKECVLDTLVWALAQMVIQQMMQDVIGWAESGFEGGPAFVQDTGRWFKDLGEEFLDEVLLESGVLELCEPFRAQIQFSLYLDTVTPRYTRGGNGSARCNIDDFLDGSSIDIFVNNGDFNSAGISGLFGIQMNNNNPVSSYLKLQNDLGKRLQDNVIAPTQNLLAYGSGYMSTKCDRDGNPDNGNEGTCTPGDFIAKQISEHASAPLNKLIQADEFAEMINALIAAFVSQLLNDDDAGGLLGSSGNNAYWDSARNDRSGTAEWCARFPDEPLCAGTTPVAPVNPSPEPELTPEEIAANEALRDELSVAINALIMNLSGRNQDVRDAYMQRVLTIQSDLFRVDVTTSAASAQLADIQERIRVILVELAIFTIELPGSPVDPGGLPVPPNPPPVPGDPNDPGPGLPPPPSLPPGYEIP